MCMLHSFLVFKAIATSWTDNACGGKHQDISRRVMKAAGDEEVSESPECSASEEEEAGVQRAASGQRTKLQELLKGNSRLP